jgi:hypothetical protein
VLLTRFGRKDEHGSALFDGSSFSDHLGPFKKLAHISGVDLGVSGGATVDHEASLVSAPPFYPSPASSQAKIGRMSPIPSDTPPDVEEILLEGYRRMTPEERLMRAFDMSRAVQQYGPDLGEREERLRLASLWLPRETMVKVFGWDPEIEGY